MVIQSSGRSTNYILHVKLLPVYPPEPKVIVVKDENSHNTFTVTLHSSLKMGALLAVNVSLFSGAIAGVLKYVLHM